MLTADILFQDFLNLLPSAIKDLNVCESKYAHWTEWVKTCFEEIGRTKGMGIRRTRVSQGESEFMLDLCWLRETETEYGMYLALECEWANKFEDDFRKLLHVRAPVKIFVFAWPSPDTKLTKMRELIEKYSFKNPQEQYLIINFPDSEEACKTRRLTFSGYRISASGQQQFLGEQSVAVPLERAVIVERKS